MTEAAVKVYSGFGHSPDRLISGRVPLPSDQRVTREKEERHGQWSTATDPIAPYEPGRLSAQGPR